MTEDKKQVPNKRRDDLLEYIEKCIDAAYHEGAVSRPLNAAGAINNALWHAKLVMGELGPKVLAALAQREEAEGDEDQ